MMQHMIRRAFGSRSYSNLSINQLIQRQASAPNDSATQQVQGWLTSARVHKKTSFLMVNDGSNPHGIQAVVNMGKLSSSQQAALKETLTVGASVQLRGSLVPHPSATPPAGQEYEMHVESMEDCKVIGLVHESYPLQKKFQTFEHLRSNGHLRLRTTTLAAVARIRSRSVGVVHQFFQEQDFVHVHTPILTPSDCEGSGEMFHVIASSDLDDAPSASIQQQDNKSANEVEAHSQFFGKNMYLTVSGQLYAEMCAASLGRVYTFGPTFRAEHSNTTRHLSEFWMLEPEVSHASLSDLMDLAENMIKRIVQHVQQHCKQDVDVLSTAHAKDAQLDATSLTLAARLSALESSDFIRMTYTEALEAISKDGSLEALSWGDDLSTIHERWLCETLHNGKPVFVTHYPASLKPFYMARDGKTAVCMDLLVPGIGELIGGSEREHDYDKLCEYMTEHKLSFEDYSWYTDLRRYGTVPHGGFGLGFERLIQLLTGMDNVRDVVVAPRAHKTAKF